MKTALIISLNFNPGHLSHLIASYKQFEELGYESVFYVNKLFEPYIPSSFKYIIYNKPVMKRVSIAIFLFPSGKNILQILKLKWCYDSRIMYVFHEPLGKFYLYMKSGFTGFKLIRLCLINIISAITVILSNIVLLPSNKALNIYDKNWMYRNLNRHYVPLMYDDEVNCSIDIQTKIYFSYIGTIASDHSFEKFLLFVESCILKGDLMEIEFLIATRSSLPLNEKFEKLINSGRLRIIEGMPISNEEINEYYSKSLIIWNAYTRTTQSGVLAKSFMFGTPTIILNNNVSEFVTLGCNVEAIVSNDSYEEILNAVNKIQKNRQLYTESARKAFLDFFYYKKYNEYIEKIIN